VTTPRATYSFSPLFATKSGMPRRSRLLRR
jgi:hypothetical protein